MVGVRQVLRSVLLPPEAPTFAGRRVGLEVGDGLRAHVSRGLEQACVTGAVPPPHRLRGRLRLGLGVRDALDAARKPYPCTASSRWLRY